MKTHFTPLRRHFLSAALLGLLLHTPVRSADQTATWNGTTGNWSDFTKWNTNPLFANNGNGGFTFDAVQTGGTLTVNQAITIEKLTMSGGTNTGAGFTLTMNDLFTFSGGTLGGTGTVQADGGVTFTGASAKIIGSGRTLNLGANSTWSAGIVRLGIGSVLATEADVTLDNSFDGVIENTSGSTAAFNNAGTFTKSAGTGVTAIGISAGAVALNNTGTVNVNTGTLRLGAGGTSTGAWNVASGATLDFQGGTHALNAGTALSALGTGIVQFSGGTTNFNAGSYSVAGTTQINGGTANFNAAASTNLLNLSSGVLGGTGTLTVNGLTTFTGGTMTGAGITQADGGVTFSGAGDKFLRSGRVLNLGANSTWSAGDINIAGASVLATEAGGTLDNSFDGVMENTGGGAATFNNAGTFTKSAGAGTTTIGGGIAVTFNNTGTVNVNSGTLQFNNSGTHAGAFNVALGTTMNFNGGTHALNAGASFAGAGTTSITGSATVNVNAPVSVGTSLLFSTSGQLAGTGTLTVNGLTTFTGGTMTGAGITQADGGVTFSGAGDKLLRSNRVLNLGANSTWIAGDINIGIGGVLATEAGVTLDNSFDGVMENTGGGAATFNNAGTFTKSAGAGTTSIGGGIAVTFNNTGTVNVNSGTLSLANTVIQHSGTTLTGGTWNVTNGASINITTGSNITTNQGTVMLDGAGSSFNRFTTALNNNQGSFTLKNNRDLTTAGAYTNSGTTRVEDSTTVMTIGSGGSAAYTQTAGVTALVNGAFIDPSVFNLNGGTLKGTGTIESNVIAGPGSNTIAPGLSPGSLTINGSLTLSSGSTLAMELGGLSQGSLYDHLDVNGVLTLAGMLDLDFINGFETGLPSGALLTLATANSAILGSFSNVASGGYLMTNFPIALQVFYGAGSPFGAANLVVAIPEPSRAMLMMLGGLALLQRRRRQE